MIKWFRKKRKAPTEQESEPETPTKSDQNAERSATAESAPEESAAGRDESATAEQNEARESETVEAEAAQEDTIQDETLEDSEEEGVAPEKRRFFKQLRQRLHKTRERLTGRVDRVVLGKKSIDDDLMDDLEEALITSDLGVRTAASLLERVAERVRRKVLTDPEELRDQLREEIRSILDIQGETMDPTSNRPFVIMVIGVNGVGKTTTIGKLANILKCRGLNVMLVAGDTFRAAAIEQLTLWGERIDVPVIRQKSGSDPSAVVFDAMDAAITRNVDVIIVDTAGRMHTKVNLMEELKKVQRVMRKKLPTAPHEVLLVLDSTTGQNALSQARMFQEAIGVSGLVLTKLDGTAKGGMVVGICDELKVPVRYIGIGEGIDDLRPFDAEEFAEALF